MMACSSTKKSKQLKNVIFGPPLTKVFLDPHMWFHYTDKTNKMNFVHSKDSERSGHDQPILISIVTAKDIN